MSGIQKQLPMSGAEQAEVTDLNEARREDVLEESTDELLSSDSSPHESVSGRFFVSESDRAVVQ